MITGDDLQDGKLVPFSETEITVDIIFLLLLSLSCLFDSVIIWSLWKQKTIPLDTQFIMSLSVADALFAAQGIVFQSIHGNLHIILCTRSLSLLPNIVMYGGWATGYLGCQLNSAIMVYSFSVSVSSVVGLTIHRYLAVIHRYHLSQREVYIIMSTMWISLAIACGVVTALDKLSNRSIYALEGSKMYCFLASTTENVVALTGMIICILVVAVSMIFICYAYFRIYHYYTHAKSRGITKSQKRENEKKLLKKGVAICTSFVVTWVFFLFKMILELGLKKSVPYEYDVFCDFIGVIGPFFNALIIYNYDSKSRQNINELIESFGLFKTGFHVDHVHDSISHRVLVPVDVATFLRPNVNGVLSLE